MVLAVGRPVVSTAQSQMSVTQGMDHVTMAVNWATSHHFVKQVIKCFLACVYLFFLLCFVMVFTELPINVTLIY